MKISSALVILACMALSGGLGSCRSATSNKETPSELPLEAVLDLKPGKKQIVLNGLFEEGSVIRDYYSGEKVIVKEGRVTLDTPHDMVLLGL